MKPFNNHSPLPWKWIEPKSTLYHLEEFLDKKDRVVLSIGCFSADEYLGERLKVSDKDFILHAINTYYETHKEVKDLSEKYLKLKNLCADLLELLDKLEPALPRCTRNWLHERYTFIYHHGLDK